MSSFFGIKVTFCSRQSLLKKIKTKLSKRAQTLIVTLNAEMLVNSVRDPEFSQILSRSFRVADSISLFLGARFLKYQKSFFKRALLLPLYFVKSFFYLVFHSSKEIVFPGIELMQEICKISEGKYKVFLFGSSALSVQRVEKRLTERFKKLNIVGYLPGEIPQIYRIKNFSKLKDLVTPNLSRTIASVSPDIIFVALGSPLQEKWLSANFRFLPSVRIGMGVGGAFDMIAGLTPRAPKFLRIRGFEWLWRLFLQPWRIKRIFRAAFVFPWLVMKDTTKENRI